MRLGLVAGLLEGINKVANPKNEGRAFNCKARRGRLGVGIRDGGLWIEW